MNRMSIGGRLAAIGLAGLMGLGCASSSHKSVRTYDYNEEGASRQASQPVETEREVESGEWEMVSPGTPVVTPR